MVAISAPPRPARAAASEKVTATIKPWLVGADPAAVDDFFAGLQRSADAGAMSLSGLTHGFKAVRADRETGPQVKPIKGTPLTYGGLVDEMKARGLIEGHPLHDTLRASHIIAQLQQGRELGQAVESARRTHPVEQEQAPEPTAPPDPIELAMQRGRLKAKIKLAILGNDSAGAAKLVRQLAAGMVSNG